MALQPQPISQTHPDATLGPPPSKTPQQWPKSCSSPSTPPSGPTSCSTTQPTAIGGANRSSFRISSNNPTDRQFVVEVLHNGKRLVAINHWQVPQTDVNQERKWPETKVDKWEMELMGRLLGGMEENRAELMGKRPQWSKSKQLSISSPTKTKPNHHDHPNSKNKEI